MEHMRKEIHVTADSVCHKVYIYRWTSLKSIHGVKQRASFQQEVVLVLAN